MHRENERKCFPDRLLGFSIYFCIAEVSCSPHKLTYDSYIRNAIQAGVPLLDLRLICNEDSDYANEIEPSVAGGEKITDAILNAIAEHDFVTRRTEIFK